MSGALLSTSWYRVATLTPRLRSHARIHRHQYRGQTWYVLQDLSSERFHRFSPAAYMVVGLMDGRRTVDQIWETACERLGDDAPTQDEVIQLLSQLHAADVLQSDVPPDAAELLERRERQARRRLMSRLLSPFAWQIPLVDPERFLRFFLPVVRPFVGWFGAALWLAVVGPAVVLAVTHWDDLTQNMVDRLLAPQNLLLLWLAFPVIKTLHEFGHAFVTKAFGGEVHDMGVMILVLTPVPYVDASAASAFRSKWQRIVVGAAGMLVELFVAAVALFAWLNVEPGTVRTLAYNAILTAGISTLLFNGNPLLRFDGYYILADLLEIPNLRSRSNTYLGYLAERYLFGRREAEPPEAAAGERAWFVSYATASFVYRVVIVLAILLFLGERSLLLALVFGVMSVVAWIVVPVSKGLKFLVASPRIRTVRGRALTVTALALAAAIAAVGFVPVPYRSETEGVVWIPDEAFARAGTEGFIERLAARPGQRVEPGALLFVLTDPALTARVQVLEARRRELLARYAEQRPKDRVRAEIIREDLGYVEEGLARARERVAELAVVSRAAGTLVVATPDDLPGRFVKQGELLGHVVDLRTITVRAVVSQAEIDLVRYQTARVDVRLAERLDESLPAVVKRVVPGASERLPTAALGSVGGGRFAVDPRDSQGTMAVERLFQIDLELPAGARVLNVGGRAYVRFDHGRAPLALQWYRHMRQLFLSRLNV